MAGEEKPAAGKDFPGGHRNGDGCRQFGMVVDLVGAEGFFDPIGIVRRETLHVAQGGWYVIPGIVGIQHEQHVGPDRLARSCDPGLF